MMGGKFLPLAGGGSKRSGIKDFNRPVEQFFACSQAAFRLRVHQHHLAVLIDDDVASGDPSSRD
jgi:hypothetical protein